MPKILSRLSRRRGLSSTGIVVVAVSLAFALAGCGSGSKARGTFDPEELSTETLLEGRVFCDLDGDGEFDLEDSGLLAGVFLLDTDGNPIDEDAAGKKIFVESSMSDGTYKIRAKLLLPIALRVGVDVEGMTESGEPYGGSQALRLLSEPVLFVGLNADTELDDDGNVISRGDERFDLDFRFAWRLGPASIGDFVWRDDDCDGIQDDDEDGLGGIRLVLKNANREVASTTSDDEGRYGFELECPGLYVIEVDDPTGRVLTTPNQGDDPSRDSEENGVLVRIEPLAPVDSDSTDRDFGFRLAAAISGQIWDDVDKDGLNDSSVEPGLADVEVELLNKDLELVATATTDATGNYEFPCPEAGEYLVEVVLATLPTDYVATLCGVPPFDSNCSPLDVVLPTNAPQLDGLDFGFHEIAAGCIGDLVWDDMDNDGLQGQGEPGLAGVKLLLEPPAGPTLETVTDTDGRYVFDELCQGTYTVRVDTSTLAPGYESARCEVGADRSLDGSCGAVQVVLATNIARDKTIDFGFRRAAGCIGGEVFTDLNGNGKRDNEPALAGVHLTLENSAGDVLDERETDATGAFSFPSLFAGDYVVRTDLTTVPAGFLATTSTDFAITLSRNDALDKSVLIGFRGPTGCIGDRVFDDADANGLQSPGELGIGGVRVVLENTSGVELGERFTTASGFFSFGSLPMGDYVVRVAGSSLPPGFIPSCGVAGPPDLDSECSPAAVTLTTDYEQRKDIDFGYVFDPCFEAEVIDFEGLSAGAVLTEVDSSNGVGPVFVRGHNPALGMLNAALVFDSAAPTGEDFDLGTPNMDFGGPGIGVGGASGSTYVNTLPLGNLLIVAEDLVDLDGDGLVDDPDDANEVGTTLEFDFSALGPVTMCALTVVDIDLSQTARVHLLGPGGTYLAWFDLPTVDDNGVARVLLGETEGVERMLIELDGSGAIDEVAFRPDALGRIGDSVWHDADADGIRDDDDDEGLGKVGVLLQDLDGATLQATTTDDNGEYDFDELAPGTYVVRIDRGTIDAGLAPTRCEAGTDRARDSDCDGVPVVLAPREDRRDIDFGFTECSPCSGGLMRMTLRYLGDDATVDAFARDAVVFSGRVASRGIFTLVGLDPAEDLGNEVDLWVDGTYAQTIRSDCSKPIGPGLAFGEFAVVFAESERGGVVCGFGTAVCIGPHKLRTLTMSYTGEGCDATNHEQDSSAVECSGDPDGATRVYVVATDNTGASYFDGPVELDRAFVLDAAGTKRGTFGGDTWIEIYDEDGRTLLQQIRFHTSCSEPLKVGDRFGALRLDDSSYR